MNDANYLQRIAAAQARYFAERENREPPTEYVYRNGYLVRQLRKLGPYDHRGVAYYDRERMRQPLPPIIHPRDFQGWSTPLPSWIDANWTAPDEVAVEHAIALPADDFDEFLIAQTSDYALERCHVETVCQHRERKHGDAITVSQPVTYRWELKFADGAIFRFVSRAVAEMALSELLKIRKAKHPRPKVGKHSAENDSVFFTHRKLQKLTSDIPTAEMPADITSIDTAA